MDPNCHIPGFSGGTTGFDGFVGVIHLMCPTLTKLVVKDKERIKEIEREIKIAGALGVEFGNLQRLAFKKGKSDYMTKEQIAQILVGGNLVKSLEEGLREIKPYLQGECYLWKGIFREYREEGSEVKYRLERLSVFEMADIVGIG